MLHNVKFSEPFEIHSGVRQLHLLFLLVVGDDINAALLSHRKKGLRWTMNRAPQHLDCAVDICLLFHKISDTQDMIRSLEKDTASADLQIKQRC